MHETQGWWNNILFIPEGKMPKWPGQATWHQICTVCIVCSSQILTSQNEVESNIYLKQQKLLLIHTFLARGED